MIKSLSEPSICNDHIPHKNNAIDIIDDVQIPRASHGCETDGLIPLFTGRKPLWPTTAVIVVVVAPKDV